ncbi:Ankyrin repeat-containing protein BDA1 [Camellia lanceoleosa]|uniref:Ankyrin repeat-containing protein BDA1 n=1 Tax=Camellia lanceoleosa TaxID=1840588 RepID=A0ACC0FDG0_9ERIC|nr:Ankyrin repeat-containing protein BDA1 [Camellia lanceoleosa]
MDRRLYEASLSGSVADLENLVGEDPLILDRASLTCFDQTPLHIAAWRGYSDFTRALLSRKPRLATELNSARCSPLHLASTEGHHEIVQHLLDVNDDVCEVHDEDGRTPLHLAAMKGRVEVIKLLTRARPESIRQKLGRGETVLHLCVKYNRLEALKTLIDELLIQNDARFVNSEDQDGNTILHLAAALKQLDLSPIKDLKTMEIQQLLVEAGVPSLRRAPDIKEEIKTSSSSADHQPQTLLKRLWKKISSFWSKYFEPDAGWFKEARVHFITASALTTTMSYQAGLSPPGSVWQDLPNNNTDLQVNNDDIGTSILANTQYDRFTYFLFYNTASFIASMCTLILASSGFPPENKFFTALMMVLMYFSLTCMTYAYLLTILMISPLNTMYFVEKMIQPALYSWFGVCIAGGLFQILRSCPWLWRKLRIRGLCSWLWHKLGINFLNTISDLWHKKLEGRVRIQTMATHDMTGIIL